MRQLPTIAIATFLLGTMAAIPAFADSPGSAGCAAGIQRTESEGGGVGTVGLNTRKTEAEGGGVGTVGLNTRKTEAEGGGVGSAGLNTRKAEAEGGGVGAVGTQMAAAAQPCK